MSVIVPPVPSNFQVQQGNGQVLVSWDIVVGSTSYTVQRSTDNVSFTTVSSPANNSYLDTTVIQGTAYYYQVAAVNGSGTSPFTNPLQIIPAQPGLLSLGQVREMSKQRADRTNSNFVTDSEWNTYINQSYFELYDILTTTYEDYYTSTQALFVTDGSSQQFSLPDGIKTFLTITGSSFVAKPMYKLLGVDCGLALSSNAWVTLHKFDFIDRNRFVFPNITSTFLGVFNLRYRLFGNTLFFIPTPSAGQYLRLWYIPRMATLLQDTDLVDGVSGWTEYIIVDAAIKAMQKEESDVTALMLQKQALIDRIQAAAMNRDAGQPDTISNTRGQSAGAGYGFPGGDGSFGGY